MQQCPPTQAIQLLDVIQQSPIAQSATSSSGYGSVRPDSLFSTSHDPPEAQRPCHWVAPHHTLHTSGHTGGPGHLHLRPVLGRRLCAVLLGDRPCQQTQEITLVQRHEQGARAQHWWQWLQGNSLRDESATVRSASKMGTDTTRAPTPSHWAALGHTLFLQKGR